MAHVPDIDHAQAFLFDPGDGERLLLAAGGSVPTSGWADVHLAPRFAPQVPADGVWEFDFLGRAPCGRVVDASLPVAASGEFAAPAWLRGVRIYAADGSRTVDGLRRAGTVCVPGEALSTEGAGVATFTAPLAAYEDGYQPPGAGAPEAGGGRWQHRLTLHLQGPDAVLLRRALADAVADGLTAALPAAYVQGGDALSAAVARLLRHLQGRLGSTALCRVDDRARWVAGAG